MAGAVVNIKFLQGAAFSPDTLCFMLKRRIRWTILFVVCFFCIRSPQLLPHNLHPSVPYPSCPITVCRSLVLSLNLSVFAYSISLTKSCIDTVTDLFPSVAICSIAEIKLSFSILK